MSVIYNTNKCQPFFNGYRPLNVMRNGRKIAGWTNKSKGGNNNSITLTGTYNDKLDYSLHGKTKIETSACIGTWRQLVQNPRPCTERTTGISRRGSGVLTFEDNGIILKNDDSGKGAFRVLLPYALQQGHRYFIGLFYERAVVEGSTYFSVAFNTSAVMQYNYNRLGYVLYAREYEDGVNTITFTLNGSNPNNESIYVNRIMVVDLTTLWGNDNLADSASYYNSDFRNMSTLIYYLEEVDPTPEATTETIIPNVESPFFSGDPTPINPCNVIPDEVWIETTDRITRNDLYSWDTLYSGGYIISYGKTARIEDLNWSYYNSNIFYWNGTNELYRPEEVYMNYYKKVDNFADLANEDYAYWVNTSNNRVYIKDIEYSNATDFKNARAEGLIYYYSATSTRRDTEVNKPNTSPYTTIVNSNSNYTVTYKKWDDSQPD